MNDAFSEHLLGHSPELQATLRAARLIAATDVTTLISGETGTGKELLAQALHRSSARHGQPMVTVNCGALPESLVEAELFGHRRGAFTGANQDQPGRIRSADLGTLFLDEVGELPLNAQVKLLRFLESGEIQPLGQAGCEQVDVRVIAATNRDLYAQVRAGRFREDLYYRLNVVPLQLPPLRERRGDIALLIDRLGTRLAQQHHLSAPRYSAAALGRLQDYPWPGNVRELRNLCERLLILLPGQHIDPANLPAQIRQAEQPAGNSLALPEHGIELEQLEASMIHQALNRVQGNQSKAARLLGVSRSALIYRMKKYAIG